MRQAGGKGGWVRRTYHIDQYVKGSSIPFLDQLGGVVVGPLGLVVQVPGEGFLAPGAFAGVGDGGVGGDGFVFPGVLEELPFPYNQPYPLSSRLVGGTHQSQSAVPAHAMSEDADPLTVHLLEVLEDGLGQLGCDVAVHLVAFVPGGFGCVEVETGAGAEVEGVVFAFDFEPTCESRKRL